MSGSLLKGLAKVGRGARVAERRARWLTRDVEEHLFRHAEVLTEGGMQDAPAGARRYFGSTMIAFDLQLLQEVWRGALDDSERKELCALVEGSVRIRLRAMRLACAEVASRVTERPLGTAVMETSVRLSGDKLLLDIDVEVPVGVCSSARRTL